MGNVLFVIGNGFDAHHGYKTSYKNFREYLRHHHFEVSSYDLYDFFSDMCEDEWNQFEDSLETIDFNDAMSYLNPQLSGDTSDKVWDSEFSRSSALAEENHEIVNSALFRDALNYALNEFISVSTKDMRPKNTYLEQLFRRNNNAKYLVFNYSTTLEKIYGISNNLLHIHGAIHSCRSPYDRHGVWIGYGEPLLVFGHGAWSCDHSPSVDYEKYENPLQPSAVLSLLNDQLSKNYQVSEMKRFFGDVQFNEVVIIGHSLGAIDSPYFEIMSNYVSSGRVIYHLYRVEEEKRHRARLQNYFPLCGVEFRDYSGANID